jgi:hypothetical protein
MSAIKTCERCGGLYTGSTPICAGCYFASLPKSINGMSPLAPAPLSRAERRALKRNRSKEESRNASQDQPIFELATRTDLHTRDNEPKDATRPRRQSPHGKPKGSKKSPSKAGTVCPLCGLRIPPRQILEHKHRVHGEAQVVPSPIQPRKENQWVSMVSGGLPSLGKNSR